MLGHLGLNVVKLYFSTPLYNTVVHQKIPVGFNVRLVFLLGSAAQLCLAYAVMILSLLLLTC